MILQELLKYPAKVPFSNVIVMDTTENEIANASADLIETTAQKTNLAN